MAQAWLYDAESEAWDKTALEIGKSVCEGVAHIPKTRRIAGVMKR